MTTTTPLESSANANTSANDASSAERPSQRLSYKGSVSGLKGLLTSKLAEGVAAVVQSVEKARESVTGVAISTQPIPIEWIVPCADQPRQVFEPKALDELAQTMRELGQAQAITVRKVGANYEIISGERRFRAAKLAGFTHLDCVVKECSAQEGRLLALVENTQRQDLLPIEEAQFLKKVLQENSHLSLEKLARMLGSHKSTISEKVQLTEIPDDLQAVLFSKGKAFTHRHWRVVSRIPNAEQLKEVFRQAIDQQLSVAELEKRIVALGVQRAPRRGSSSGAMPRLRLVRRDNGVFRFRSVSIDPGKLSEEARVELVQELEAILQEIRKPSEWEALSTNSVTEKV